MSKDNQFAYGYIMGKSQSGGSTPAPVLGYKEITENGEYYAEDDGYNGYNVVNVNVVPTQDEVYISNNYWTAISLFNQPVRLAQMSNCTNLFRDYNDFNQPVNIPNYTTDCSYMFYNCPSLNSPVSLCDQTTQCNYMFYGCEQFNQPVNIPSYARNCGYMFTGCNNFNQPLTIPANVMNMREMLSLCKNFNQPLVIPVVETTN